MPNSGGRLRLTIHGVGPKLVSTMPAWQTVLVLVAAWMALVLILRWIGARWLSHGPAGDPTHFLTWQALRVYCRLVHRLTVSGLEHVPPTNRPGGLVVVSSHTGPVDALIIQAACPFKIRWMMATDFMIPKLAPFWQWLRLIPVDRDGRDSGPVRAAIRHVRGGGVVGIFPEGAIPARGEIRPYHPGVGLIIARTKAPVLLVWVSGTPESTEMFRALGMRSRARVHFVDYLEFGDQRDPAAITAELRRRVMEASGWPANDEPLPPRAKNPDPFAA